MLVDMLVYIASSNSDAWIGSPVGLLDWTQSCLLQCPARDDEGPVRQLRGAEDDRRGGADAAQGADAQDPAAHRLAAQVHVRQAHNR